MKSLRCWIAYAGVSAVLGATLVASHFAPSRSPEKLQAPLDTISKEIDGWTMFSGDEFRLTQIHATQYVARTYVKDRRELGLLVAYHDNHQGAVGIHNPNNCLPGDGWEIWKAESANVMFDGQPVAVNQYHISKRDQRKAVLYWYQSRRRVIANELQAKFMLMRDAVLEGRTSGAFVRIAVPDDPELVSQGLRFAETVMHQVQVCFRP